MDTETISVYNRNNLIRIRIRDIVKYHGGLCPGILIGFKAMKLAIKQLWDSETPERNDFIIVVSDRTRVCAIDALEFIARVRTRGNLLIKTAGGEGMDWGFIFISKSRSKAVEVKLKEKISPKEMLPRKKRGEFTAFIQDSDIYELFDVREMPYRQVEDEINRLRGQRNQ